MTIVSFFYNTGKKKHGWGSEGWEIPNYVRSQINDLHAQL